MKKIIVLLLIMLMLPRVCFADELNEYYDIFKMNELDEHGDFKTVFRKTMQGDFAYLKDELDPRQLFLSEINDCMDILRSLLMICMLNGLVAALNFGNGKTEYMSFMISRILAAGLCLKAISRITGIMTSFSDMLLGIVSAAIPVITALLAVSGRAALSSSSAVVMYAALTLMAWAIKKLILPCIGFYAVCGLINCISPQGMLTRLAKLIYGFINNGMKCFGFLFGIILAVERAATVGADTLVKKTAVSAVKAVPVVGDVFAAGAESVFSLMSSLNGGFASALIIFITICCIVPLVKVFTAALMFRIAAALSEPLGDKGITGIIDTAGSVCSLMFSVMLGLGLIFMGAAAVLLFSVT